MAGKHEWVYESRGRIDAKPGFWLGGTVVWKICMRCHREEMDAEILIKEGTAGGDSFELY